MKSSCSHYFVIALEKLSYIIFKEIAIIENEKEVELSVIELLSWKSSDVAQWLLFSFTATYAFFFHTSHYGFIFYYLLMLIYFGWLAIQGCQEYPILQDWFQYYRVFRDVLCFSPILQLKVWHIHSPMCSTTCLSPCSFYATASAVLLYPHLS